MSSSNDAAGPIGPRSIPPDRGPAAAQPRWRRDFPIDWDDDDYVSRRDLLKYVVLTSGAFVVGQFWILCKTLLRAREAPLAPEPVAQVDELAVGAAKTFNYPAGSPPRLLVRLDQSTFVAYDQQCTHLGCPLVPAVAEGKLHCPCHNGWFDVRSGTPLAGPPQRRLPRVAVEVRDRVVYATGIEE